MKYEEIHNKEFDYLRKEIEFFLDKINSMISLLYVSVTVVLAWAIESKNPLFCSAVFCIIIPSYIVTHSYNIGILKIGAYFMVFYDEDYKWDNRSHMVNQQSKKKFNRLSASYKFPYIFVGALSGILAWIIFLEDFNNFENNILWFNNIFIVLFSISFILVVLKQKNTDEIKEFYKSEWIRVREKE